jgi:hypothetical protein
MAVLWTETCLTFPYAGYAASIGRAFLDEGARRRAIQAGVMNRLRSLPVEYRIAVPTWPRLNREEMDYL